MEESDEGSDCPRFRSAHLSRILFLIVGTVPIPSKVYIFFLNSSLMGMFSTRTPFFFFRTPLSESPSPFRFFSNSFTGLEFLIQHRVNRPAVQVLHWLVFQQLGSAMTLQWFQVNEPGVRRVGSYVFGCFHPKIGGKPPKMDGENNGKPYEQMDDLGGGGFTSIFWKYPNDARNLRGKNNRILREL